MKKYYLSVAVVLSIAACMGLNSCIGSFALTNKVLAWNNQVSNKFVNEVVFFCFCILPVYEVTALADLIVLNSVEFWSGENPIEASVKTIDTDHGRYLVDCDGKGYTITDPSGEQTRLNFSQETKTWSVVDANGQDVPFMTYLDPDHVKMYAPDGGFTTVELSQSGVLAYEQLVNSKMYAKN